MTPQVNYSRSGEILSIGDLRINGYAHSISNDVIFEGKITAITHATSTPPFDSEYWITLLDERDGRVCQFKYDSIAPGLYQPIDLPKTIQQPITSATPSKLPLVAEGNIPYLAVGEVQGFECETRMRVYYNVKTTRAVDLLIPHGKHISEGTLFDVISDYINAKTEELSKQAVDVENIIITTDNQNRHLSTPKLKIIK